MFQRRHKLGLANQIGGYLWPRIGWRRAVRYFVHRLGRMPGTPHSIAAGFACGVAASFTPLVGLHILLAIIVSWLIGGSFLSAVLGTLAGNPWTFPFIWLWIYNLGLWLGIAAADTEDLQFGVFFGDLYDAALRMDVSYMIDQAWPLLAPMLVGGAISGLVVWLAFYFFLKPVLKAYQNKALQRRSPIV
ncbi:MAG: hypothetical protein ACJAU6_001883 [Alphaproteobacteria bacterium]|jgi:uncharacterized protein (DUF2062 family)